MSHACLGLFLVYVCVHEHSARFVTNQLCTVSPKLQGNYSTSCGRRVTGTLPNNLGISITVLLYGTVYIVHVALSLQG
jgi:hypothetical protein